MFSRVFLKKGEENELQQGFPWVFDNEIDFLKVMQKSGVTKFSLDTAPVKDGDVVEVYANAGGFLGTGIINRKSKITVRIIGKEYADKIMENPEAYYEQKIKDAFELRKLYFNKEDSYRLIYGEADLIPGLIVERFCASDGKVFLVIQFLSLSAEVFRKEIVNALVKIIKPEGIYERDDASVREKEGLLQQTGWIYGSGTEKITIKENGILLEVDIKSGQKTGYFLDQKFNRKSVAALSKGKRVLDTFTHTGAFGLNCFSQGAKEVTCVDLSEEAIETVNKNIMLNNAGNKVKAVCADVFDLLKQYEEQGEKFDLIILDPPAFTKSAKNIQKAYGGYKEINLRAMRLLNKNGILATCSCSYFFDESHFYGMIMNAAKDSKKHIQILQKSGASPDHPVLSGYPKSDYLKCAVCRVM